MRAVQMTVRRVPNSGDILIVLLEDGRILERLPLLNGYHWEEVELPAEEELKSPSGSSRRSKDGMRATAA
jgi:hypothetical protein